MITTEDIEAFRRDGVVILRDVLSADELATLEAGVEKNLDRSG